MLPYMHNCSDIGSQAAERPGVALVGNPNVGKSVIFGYLTGRYVEVSNYPGTTVEVTQGTMKLRGHAPRVVVDTPGIASLVPLSEDEQVTRDILLRDPAAVVQVADSKNLRRALFITLELSEMGLPLVLALNMQDEAQERGIRVDAARLSELLGAEVIETVATRRHGLERLRRSLPGARPASAQVKYPEPVERAVAALEPLLPAKPFSARSLALMLLAGDESLLRWLDPRLSVFQRQELKNRLLAVRQGSSPPLDDVIFRARQQAVESLMAQVYTAAPELDVTWVHRAGQLAMHPVWGLFVLAAVLVLMYFVVGKFGAGTCVDFVEKRVFEGWLNPWAVKIVSALTPGPLLLVREALVGEFGLLTVGLKYAIAIVLPIVATFFLFFGLLEDSGYLPRLAVMANRVFKLMGLNGKAVLPMVLGLGCDTMATLTARILDSKKERVIVTLLLALGVPCSAQLGVILGMLERVSWAATLIWAGSVVGVMFLVGWLAARIIPGRGSDFVIEVPPLRIPQLGNIVTKTLARMEWYLREAVPLFLIGTFVLFLFDKLKLLGAIETFAAPVVQDWLQLPAQATSAFIIGFLRRDYGAAGLFTLERDGLLDPIQVVVSMVTITLFVPCIANFFIIIKERGWKTAAAMTAFIFAFAFGVGGALNYALRALGVSL